MHHGIARLTVHGRRATCRRVLEEGWTVTAAAAAAPASRQPRSGPGRPSQSWTGALARGG
jgi:hypothetical protein